MSVQVFSAEDLGNVAKALEPSDPAGFLYWCTKLAAVSQANAKAYSATYNEECEPSTAEEVAQAAPGLSRVSMARAARTVELLHYNTVANDGEAFMEGNAGEALVVLQAAMLSRVVDQAFPRKAMRA